MADIASTALQDSDGPIAIPRNAINVHYEVELVVVMSNWVTLEPGDPVEIAIEAIGVLRNQVTAANRARRPPRFADPG